MRAKAIVGVIAALVPVVYCGGLVFHFVHTEGSIQQAADIGLDPTLLGLTIVGVLFLIPVFFKVAKIFSGPRSPGSGGSTPDGDGGIDADAIVARYLAQRSAENDAGSGSGAPAPRAHHPHVQTGGVQPKAGGFGRKTR
jgi:hypothetical protein